MENKEKLPVIAVAREEKGTLVARELSVNGISSRPIAESSKFLKVDVEPNDLAKLSKLVFSAQLLPCSLKEEAQSISKWSVKISEWLNEHLSDEEFPWRLHIIDSGVIEKGEAFQRARLIQDGIFAWFKKNRKNQLKRMCSKSTENWRENELLFQVLLLSSNEGYLSFTPPTLREQLRFSLSRFPGGFAQIPDDKNPPSRAYKKLLEALAILEGEIKSGSNCVDLGASPGGWTAVALKSGAKVIAVDRSPLEDNLMRNRNVEFIKGNAFSYKPAKRVDWLLCDVAAFPAETIKMLKAWLLERRCKNFVTTIKFKGDPQIEVTKEIQQLLATASDRWFLKQLCHNKNEATVAGTIK